MTFLKKEMRQNESRREITDLQLWNQQTSEIVFWKMGWTKPWRRSILQQQHPRFGGGNIHLQEPFLVRSLGNIAGSNAPVSSADKKVLQQMARRHPPCGWLQVKKRAPSFFPGRRGMLMLLTGKHRIQQTGSTARFRDVLIIAPLAKCQSENSDGRRKALRSAVQGAFWCTGFLFIKKQQRNSELIKKWTGSRWEIKFSSSVLPLSNVVRQPLATNKVVAKRRSWSLALVAFRVAHWYVKRQVCEDFSSFECASANQNWGPGLISPLAKRNLNNVTTG